MNTFHLTPIGSMYAFPPERSIGYLDIIITLPKPIKNLISNATIPSYITGISKNNQISEELQPIIAFTILRIAIGKIKISEFTNTLTNELGVNIEIAQEIASEIDQDLFAPIQSDLDAFWAQQSAPKPTTPVATPIKQTGALSEQATRNNNRTPIVNTTPTSPSTLRGAKNILDLKELPARPEQKDLPARPIQKTLMPGSRTVDLKNTPPRTPSSLPEQGREAKRPTPPAPPIPPKRTFPLPPSQRS